MFMVTLSKVSASSQSLGFCCLGNSRAKMAHQVIKRLFSSQLTKGLTRGDIVQFQGQFEGEGGHVVQSKKNRPYIVISSDRVMEVTKRVALAPLSTTLARYEYETIIQSNVQTGLDEPSKVMANQIQTVFLGKGFVKIGSAYQYLPKIDRALATCFGDSKISQLIMVARGDVVEIKRGNFIGTGVVVSNDMGNEASQIAMLAHSLQKNEKMNEFDVIVRKEGAETKEELLIQCYMINTFSQENMNKKGRIIDSDMKRITSMLFKTLGLENKH
jgi:mRNA-degrading endonuclease toxin of MazEF toxin-antitoxin module